MSAMIPVVAVALFDSVGRVLMQRRSLHRAHGGLWEFPGGKVELGEALDAALVREISEELAIRLDPADLVPLTFAARGGEPVLLLLYVCSVWDGEAACLDGEEIGWFDKDELLALPMPPLDVPLARAVKELLERSN